MISPKCDHLNIGSGGAIASTFLKVGKQIYHSMCQKNVKSVFILIILFSTSKKIITLEIILDISIIILCKADCLLLPP